MIPKIESSMKEFELKEKPGKTYRIDLEKNRLNGVTDGLAAVKQAVFKILSTERYEYAIYSWNYGTELLDLFGEPEAYVRPEIKGRIEEALLQDDRVQSVDSFEIEQSGRTLHITFTVHTKYGDISAGKEVTV